MTTPSSSPGPASESGVRRKSRRDFLRMAAGVIGGALAVAGVADLGIQGVQLNPNSQYSKYLTPTTTSSSASQGFLPDYLAFLEWLQSVSDKVPSKTSELTLEQEFAPYGAQALDPSFLQYSGIAAGYSELPYLSQLATVQVAVSTKSPSYDVYSIDNQNIASFENGVISPSQLAQAYPELTYPNYNVDDFMTTVWDYVAAYPPITAGSSASTSTPTSTLVKRICSAKPPASPYPKDRPLVSPHKFELPDVQYSHLPHVPMGRTATWAPIFRPTISLPTAATCAQISWPITWPGVT